MGNLKKMTVYNDALWYGKRHYVGIEDFCGFFSEDKLTHNSVLYDEEKEGYIIDIKYPPFRHRYYEYLTKDYGEDESIAFGPFLLEMKELEKPENAYVKELMKGILAICDNYRNYTRIKSEMLESGDLPTNLEDAKFYYNYVNNKYEETKRKVHEQFLNKHKKDIFLAGAVVATGATIALGVANSNWCILPFFSIFALLVGSAMAPNSKDLIFMYAGEPKLEENVGTMKELNVERIEARKRCSELLENENSMNRSGLFRR